MLCQTTLYQGAPQCPRPTSSTIEYLPKIHFCQMTQYSHDVVKVLSSFELTKNPHSRSSLLKQITPALYNLPLVVTDNQPAGWCGEDTASTTERTTDRTSEITTDTITDLSYGLTSSEATGQTTCNNTGMTTYSTSQFRTKDKPDSSTVFDVYHHNNGVSLNIDP